MVYHTDIYLIGMATFGIIALLLLILVARLHAFVALVVVSFAVALLTGIPLASVVPTAMEGFGTTLATIALLVGFGAMIGRILEVSGAVMVLTDRLIALFGEARAPFALGVASLIFGVPMFFDAGLVVMLPVIFGVARRLGGSVLLYALPAAGAFAVMHALLPPHPGPVAAAELFGADLGLLTLVGLLVAVPTWFLGGYLFGLFIGRRIDVPTPATLTEQESAVTPPPLWLVLAVLLLPLVLIAMNTVTGTLVAAGVVDDASVVTAVLRLGGQTPIALLVTVLFAMATLGLRGRNPKALESLVNDALGPVCGLILVTGAGGMFGGVLRAGGVGDAVSNGLTALGLPLIVAVFIAAAALRVAQGSATVALTTTAALFAPAVATTTGLSALDLCFLVIAVASGATILSHVNDSGFWLVSRFLQIDEATTLRTWTVMVTVLGLTGFTIAWLGWILF